MSKLENVSEASMETIVRRLFTVTDYSKADDDWELAWYAAVWANSPERAVEWAIENYRGEHHDPKQAGIRVMLEHSELARFSPLVTQEENRREVLRLAGWRHGEDDHQCESCGLASMGEEKYEVCSECYLCKECRRDDDEPCQWCMG